MDIDKLRQKIDKINHKLLKLINKRAKISIQIGKIKQEKNIPIYDPKREKEIIKELISKNLGPLSNEQIENIFKQIITECRNIQFNQGKAGFLGPKYTFSYNAGLAFFQNKEILEPFNTIQEIFNALVENKISYGIIPIENSIAGFVSENIELLIKYKVPIQAEIIIPIELYFGTKSPNKNIEFIYSHKFGIEESKEWIKNNFQNTKIIKVNSTAKAAELASLNEKSGAIASYNACQEYGLSTLEKITNNEDNFTRFFIISNKKILSKTNKIACYIEFKNDNNNELLRINELIQQTSSKLRKLFLIPSKKDFNYYCYIELQGENINQIINSKFIEDKILGLFA